MIATNFENPEIVSKESPKPLDEVFHLFPSSGERSAEHLSARRFFREGMNGGLSGDLSRKPPQSFPEKPNRYCYSLGSKMLHTKQLSGIKPPPAGIQMLLLFVILSSYRVRQFLSFSPS